LKFKILKHLRWQFFFFIIWINIPAKAQLTSQDLDSAFGKSQVKIAGEGRACNRIATITGDLNGDGNDDAIVYYSCGIESTVGKATTGGGWAVWLYKNGRLEFLLNDEKKFGLAPREIETDGTIACDQLQYDAGNSMPKVIDHRKVQLKNNKLVLLK
jgi:hypothetical protein